MPTRNRPASKRCAGCEVEKYAGDFYPHPGNRDGIASRCQTCVTLKPVTTGSDTRRTASKSRPPETR